MQVNYTGKYVIKILPESNVCCTPNDQKEFHDEHLALIDS